MRQNPARIRKSLAIIVTGLLTLCPLMMLSGAALTLGGQVKGGGIKRKEVLPKKSPAPIARRSTPPKPPNNTKTGAKNTVTPKPSSSTQNNEQSRQEVVPCGRRSVIASAHAPQKKKRSNPTLDPSQQTSDQNPSSSPQSRKINLLGMQCSETAEGAVVSFIANEPLNEYAAYRNGDKYYVRVPDLDARRARDMRGRGFDNVQVQKVGNDTVFIFHLQPGAKASVRQNFNQLEVVFTVPSGQSPPATNAKPPD